jgi:hypothetical protein
MAINPEAAKTALEAASKIVQEGGAVGEALTAATKLAHQVYEGATGTHVPTEAALAIRAGLEDPRFITHSVSMRNIIEGRSALPNDMRLPELTSKGDPATYITQTASMRSMVESGNIRAVERFIGDTYYPKLSTVFPKDEIETPERYMEMLVDKRSTWDMLGLRNRNFDVLGGIQYQTVKVGGEQINVSAWGEHVWLGAEARNIRNFNYLINTTRSSVKGRGADHLTMEFNDPLKMTDAEFAEDAALGIAPHKRVMLWNRVGIHLSIGEDGKITDYAQPGMEGLTKRQDRAIQKLVDLNDQVIRHRFAYHVLKQPEISDQKFDQLVAQRAKAREAVGKFDSDRREGAVTFLSLGHISDKRLSGIGDDGKAFNKTMPLLDDLKLKHALHRTIDGIYIPEDILPRLMRAREEGNLLQEARRFQGITDPTVLDYTVNNIATGNRQLSFVPLQDVYGHMFHEPH